MNPDQRPTSYDEWWGLEQERDDLRKALESAQKEIATLSKAAEQGRKARMSEKMTLEEIEAEVNAEPDEFLRTIQAGHNGMRLLEIARERAGELERLRGQLNTAAAKMVECAEIAASSYREGQQAPASRKWSESMNYKLALAICQKAAELG
jgi:DNA repair exonuclease SbcCD ATPase subunit